MSREQQCAMKYGKALPLILVPLAALIALTAALLLGAGTAGADIDEAAWLVPRPYEWQALCRSVWGNRK
jgi:hypothetical protein